MLKSIATGSNKPSQAQKQTKPYARKLDGVVALEVDRFEEVDGQIFAVGTNLETSENMMITREWSSHPRNNGRPNPMKSASDRLQSGAIMMFTGVDPFASSDLKNAYHAAGFETVTTFADPDASVTLEDKKSVFVDQIDTGPDGEKFQLYSVVQGDESIMVETPEALVRAFASHISEADPTTDGILLRIYSPEEGIASVIRFLLSPEETLEEALNRFTESEAHYIEMVGAQEGVMEVSGPMLMSMIADNEMGAIWEVIPVKGYQHGISHPNKDISENLRKKAQEVFAEAVVDANGALHGFRKATFAYQAKQYANGKVYHSVRAYHHEPELPQALALVPTGHVDDLVDKFGQGPLSSGALASDKVDVSDLIKKLAAEVEARRAPPEPVQAPEPEIEEVDFMDDAGAESEISDTPEDDINFMADETPEDVPSSHIEVVEDFLSDDYFSPVADVPAEGPDIAPGASVPEIQEAVSVEKDQEEASEWDFPETDILSVEDDTPEEEIVTDFISDDALPSEEVAEETSTENLDVDGWFDDEDTLDLSSLTDEVEETAEEVQAEDSDPEPEAAELMSAFDDAVYDMDGFDDTPSIDPVVEAEVHTEVVTIDESSVVTEQKYEIADLEILKEDGEVAAPQLAEEKPNRVRVNDRAPAAQPTTIDRPMPLKGRQKSAHGTPEKAASEAPKAVQEAPKPVNHLADFKPDPADEISLASGITGARDYSFREIMKTPAAGTNLASSEPHVTDNDDPLSEEALASAFGLT
ncbi:hypothetical protein [Sulfitobacter sp. R18_1]|uniref:hypothetical protein n=1 Tax=Sulfitobacter sp. R18_1 TaxID=2821104 RepID=UPI001AD9C9BF|nr:hypothetical protein [Sulfitobacter sp. R18_1]MBO9428446.1 hypothetical protein [Sulfitobacter sp. R18_1]